MSKVCSFFYFNHAVEQQLLSWSAAAEMLKRVSLRLPDFSFLPFKFQHNTPLDPRKGYLKNEGNVAAKSPK